MELPRWERSSTKTPVEGYVVDLQHFFQEMDFILNNGAKMLSLKLSIDGKDLTINRRAYKQLPGKPSTVTLVVFPHTLDWEGKS